MRAGASGELGAAGVATAERGCMYLYFVGGLSESTWEKVGGEAMGAWGASKISQSGLAEAFRHQPARPASAAQPEQGSWSIFEEPARSRTLARQPQLRPRPHAPLRARVLCFFRALLSSLVLVLAFALVLPVPVPFFPIVGVVTTSYSSVPTCFHRRSGPPSPVPPLHRHQPVSSLQQLTTRTVFTSPLPV